MCCRCCDLVAWAEFESDSIYEGEIVDVDENISNDRRAGDTTLCLENTHPNIDRLIRQVQELRPSARSGMPLPRIQTNFPDQRSQKESGHSCRKHTICRYWLSALYTAGIQDFWAF